MRARRRAASASLSARAARRAVASAKNAGVRGRPDVSWPRSSARSWARRLADRSVDLLQRVGGVAELTRLARVAAADLVDERALAGALGLELAVAVGRELLAGLRQQDLAGLGELEVGRVDRGPVGAEVGEHARALGRRGGGLHAREQVAGLAEGAPQ
jgi:hypothetical protein